MRCEQWGKELQVEGWLLVRGFGIQAINKLADCAIGAKTFCSEECLSKSRMAETQRPGMA